MHIGANALDMTVDRTAITLLAILMFGAGTDYCLLLVARYSAELRAHDDKHTAIGNAVRRAGPGDRGERHGRRGRAAHAAGRRPAAQPASSGPVNAVGRGDRAGRVADAAAGAARGGRAARLLAVVRARGAADAAAQRLRSSHPACAPLPQALIDALDATIDAHPAVRQRDGIWRKVGRRVAEAARASRWSRRRCARSSARSASSPTPRTSNVVGQFRTTTESTEGFELLRAGFPPGTLYPNTVLVDRPGRRRCATDDGRAAAGARARRRRRRAGAARRGTSEDGSAATFVVDVRRRPVPGPGARSAPRTCATLRGRARAAGHRGARRRRHGAARRLPRRARKSDTKKVVPARAARDHRAAVRPAARDRRAAVPARGDGRLSFFATLGISLVVFDMVLRRADASTRRCRCSRSSSWSRWGSTTTSS